MSEQEVEPMDTSPEEREFDTTEAAALATALPIKVAEKPFGEAETDETGGGVPNPTDGTAIVIPLEAAEEPFGNAVVAESGEAVPGIESNKINELTEFPQPMIDPETGDAYVLTIEDEDALLVPTGSVMSNPTEEEMAYLLTPRASRHSTPMPTEETWNVISSRKGKRAYKDDKPEWARLLEKRQIFPNADAQLQVKNNAPSIAPAYYSEPEHILSPFHQRNRDQADRKPEVRETVTLEDAIAFREKTEHQVKAGVVRKYTQDASIPPPEKEHFQCRPTERNGARPVVYRVTHHFKGQYRFLEAVHFELFIGGREDLRVLQLDNRTVNVDGNTIRLSDCVPGDLFLVYDVVLLNPKSRDLVAGGKCKVNAILEDKDYFAPWVADVVAPLPRTPTCTKLCYANRKAKGAGADIVVPGNPQACLLPAGEFKLKPKTYVEAKVRATEAAWVFPVEPVPEGNKWAYMNQVAHVRSIYQTSGPFPVSAKPITANFKARIADRVGEFNAYSTDTKAARRLLSDTVALGCAIRACEEVAAELKDAKVVLKSVRCELPNPVETTLEIRGIQLSLDQMDRVCLRKSENLPRLVVTPRSVEMTDENGWVFCVVGTIDMSHYANLLEYVSKSELDPLDLSLEYEGQIFPKPQSLDIISEITSSQCVGEPGFQGDGTSLDRLYGLLRAVAMPPHNGTQMTVPLVGGGTLSLNDQQSLAVHEVIAERKALIVRSPPGSGKTLTAAVMAAMVGANRSVLMCAVTNSAVKNMADNVSKISLDSGVEAVRLVSAQVISRMQREEKSAIDLNALMPRIMQRLLNNPKALHTSKEAAKEFLKLRSEIAALDKEFSESSGGTRSQVLRRYHRKTAEATAKYRKHSSVAFYGLRPKIVLSTINFAVMSKSMMGANGVIIDEASQVTEAQLLCLIRQYPRASFILIGDPLQLNPHRYEDKEEQKLAGRSALEVAGKRGGYAVIQLEQVYRAYPSLTNLYSKSFYKGQLVPVRPEINPACRSVLSHANFDPPQSGTFMVVDTSTTTVARNASRSIKNEEEAQMALTVITKLMRGGVLAEDILAICLYGYQQSALRCLLSGRHIPVEVLTVDSAQGRERRVVLLLTSRVKGGKSNFFEDPRRVNVAISRQKDALVIFGNPALLRPLDAWFKLMQIADEAGVVKKLQ